MSSVIHKSYDGSDPIITYCTKMTVKQDPVQTRLMKETLEKSPKCAMLGAPEVLQLGQNMIRLIKAKKALDIGTFTGASAISWAIALPEDGHVLSMDITHDSLDQFGLNILKDRPEILKKIDFKLGKAMDILDSLLVAGQAGQWDFAFIDADKINYPHYYEKCVQLLKPTGVLIMDNALWAGTVVNQEKGQDAAAIDQANRIAFEDERVDNILLNLGDGTHLIFKK